MNNTNLNKDNGMLRYAAMMKNAIPNSAAKSTQYALNRTAQYSKHNWNKEFSKKDFTNRTGPRFLQKLVGYETNKVSNNKIVDLRSLYSVFGAWKNVWGKNEGDYLAIQELGGIKRPSKGHGIVSRGTKSARSGATYSNKIKRTSSRAKFNKNFESPKSTLRGINDPSLKFRPKTQRGRKNAYNAYFWKSVKKNKKSLFVLRSLNKTGKYAYKIKAYQSKKRKSEFKPVYNVDKKSYKVKRTPWMEHSYRRAYYSQQNYFNNRLSKELIVLAQKNNFI